MFHHNTLPSLRFIDCSLRFGQVLAFWFFKG